jgi:MoxR-like ATPase
VKLVLATHPDDPGATPLAKKFVRYGASPRGAQALILGAKVRALLDGRANISFDDIDRIAPAALEHRIMLNYAAHSDNVDTARIVEQVVKAVRQARV